ncbi:MAG TPA: DMT family transporter [Solirubrobacteraceae bacterium]|nr:DMT family transporter [Solirubrobacteraceae bacterium]
MATARNGAAEPDVKPMTTRAWVAFAAMSVIWGVPYLFIKIAVDGGVPPLGLAWARVALAAVVVLALAARAGLLRTVKGRLGVIFAFAVIEIMIPFPLIAFGEQRLPSSLTAILIATVPLIVAVLSWLRGRSERPTAVQLAGLLMGFAGVVALVGIDVAHRPGELLGALAVIGAATGYAIGAMIVKHGLADLDPRATMGVALAMAAVLLAPGALLTAPEHPPSAGAIASIVVLGLVCTALAFVVYSALIIEAGAQRAVVITYINPVVAVALGVALLGEEPGVSALAGLVLILVGSWLSTDGRVPALRRRGQLAGGAR